MCIFHRAPQILKFQPVLILNGQIAANRDKISPAQMFKCQICFDLNMQNQDQMIIFPYDQIRLPLFLLIQFILPLIWSVAAALKRVADTFIHRQASSLLFPTCRILFLAVYYHCCLPSSPLLHSRSDIFWQNISDWNQYQQNKTWKTSRNWKELRLEKLLMILRLHFENHDYKFLFEV